MTLSNLQNLLINFLQISENIGQECQYRFALSNLYLILHRCLEELS